MYRQGQLLNLRSEKISEDEFYIVVRSATQKIFPRNELKDYTVTEVVPKQGMSCNNNRNRFKAQTLAMFY